MRTTMAELVARVRSEIGDPTGASQAFTDQEIQDALDLHRTAVFTVPLRPARSYLAGGTVQYLDYYAPRGFWESDEVLIDASYAALSPASADRLAGHWTFSTSQIPTVYISGTCYDIHGAAADLLEAWAAQEKLYHAFSGDREEETEPSQRSGGLTALAKVQRRRSWHTGIRVLAGAGASW